ncbi:unnamed protein product [Lampetra planeri]
MTPLRVLRFAGHRDHHQQQQHRLQLPPQMGGYLERDNWQRTSVVNVSSEMPSTGSQGHGGCGGLGGSTGGSTGGSSGSERAPRSRRRTPRRGSDPFARGPSASPVVVQGSLRHSVTPLPAPERALCLLIAIAGHAYAFYIVHLVSREHEEELHAEFELEKGFFVWGFKKASACDPTDFEWTFWSHWASSRLLWMLLGHVLLSQLFSHSAPQLRPWGWLAYGLACCAALLGTGGAAVVLAHVLASYAAAQLRRPALCWLTSLGLLAGLQAAHWSHTQGWYESENEYFLLLFTLAMTNLRCTSFSLELCRQADPPCPSVPHQPRPPAPAEQTDPSPFTQTAHPATGSSLFWPLVYTFYYPPLHNGPIMSYCDFVARMPRLPLLPLLPWLPRLPWLAVRVAAWWALAELMLHLGYFSVLHQHEELLESLPSATLACLAIAHVSFFYVKYLVLFGVPSLAMHLDGVQPPPLPRCVSITHGFSDMWRNFDVGLHRWLLRYVYVPLGGSQGGALRQAISCGAVFLYVFFWHGAQAYLLFWATLNWLGVTVETGLGRALSSTPAERLSLGGRLSPLGQRRLLGVIAGASTAMVILSNLVFLGGTAVGAVYWDRVFLQGWPWTTLGVLSFLYCCAQFGMDWDQAKVP